MLRSAVGKVMWVGRAAVFMVGLSVMLALVLGVASAALAGNLDPLKVGSLKNVATKTTALVGRVATGSAFVVKNPSGGSALELQVGSPATSPADQAAAPMKVNSQAKVANLNADKLDGVDASQLGTPQPEPWHEVGTAGEPAFESGFSNFEDTEGGRERNTVAFYKDPLGVVRLKGQATVTSSSCVGDEYSGYHQTVFTLPAGYRPAAWELQATWGEGVKIAPDGTIITYCSPGEIVLAAFDGITFRAAN